jgi:hypothetical protein
MDERRMKKKAPLFFSKTTREESGQVGLDMASQSGQDALFLFVGEGGQSFDVGEGGDTLAIGKEGVCAVAEEIVHTVQSTFPFLLFVSPFHLFLLFLIGIDRTKELKESSISKGCLEIHIHSRFWAEEEFQMGWGPPDHVMAEEGKRGAFIGREATLSEQETEEGNGGTMCTKEAHPFGRGPVSIHAQEGRLKGRRILFFLSDGLT